MMNRPNFKDLKNLIKAIDDTNEAYKNIYNERLLQEDSIKKLCNKIAGEQAQKELFEVSVDELKNAKAGIRVQALIDAGYRNLGQIAQATDFEIQTVNGIGEKQTEAIRAIITDFANSLAAKVTIRLDIEATSDNAEDNAALITELANYINSEKVRKDALEAASNLDAYAQKIKDSGMIRNSFRCLFSVSGSKQNTVGMT